MEMNKQYIFYFFILFVFHLMNCQTIKISELYENSRFQLPPDDNPY